MYSIRNNKQNKIFHLEYFLMKTIDNQIEKIKRLKAIQDTFKLKQSDFAKKIGLTQSKVSLIYNEKAGANILNEIFYRLNYEFGISKAWWENGVGEMINSENIYNAEDLSQTHVQESNGFENMQSGKYGQSGMAIFISGPFDHLMKELPDFIKTIKKEAEKRGLKIV